MIELLGADGDLLAKFECASVGCNGFILCINAEGYISCHDPIRDGLFSIPCFVIMAGQLQSKLVALISRYGFQSFGNFPMQYAPFSRAEFIIEILLGQTV